MLPRSDMRGALYEARLGLQRALERLEGRKRVVTRPQARSLGGELAIASVSERPAATRFQSAPRPAQGRVEVLKRAPEVLPDVPAVAPRVSMWARLWSALGRRK